MTIARTSLGDLRGTESLTRQADVQSFLGVPFAEPPVGANRFRPPVALLPWAGVRDVKRFGPAAPQNPDPILGASGFFQPPTSEAGCLNLNVWTPAADDSKRPVMVWVHGGGNVSGSNSSGFNSGAELAAAFDVVVVSINYRLGALGFLSLPHWMGPEFHDSGNLAILDQLAALGWVRSHIENFGGDPEKVTLFGESAGGAAVAALLSSPLSAGLFRRAIIQSGTAERARTIDESLAFTDQFLAAAGLTAATAHRLLDMPIEQLLAAQAIVHDEVAARTIGLPLPFQSVIDGRVLPLMPLESIRGGVNSDVDLLVGTNLNEGSFFAMKYANRAAPSSNTGTGHPEPIAYADDQLEVLFGEDFPGEPDAPARYAAALAGELGSEPTDKETLESYLSDRLYRQPTNRLLAARQGSGGKNFSYLFTWQSPVMGGAIGASHAMEVPFVFRQLHRLESISLVGEKPPFQLSDAMSSAWVRFATEGVPDAPTFPEWSQHLAPDRLTMRLDVQPMLLSDPRAALREMWEQRSWVS